MPYEDPDAERELDSPLMQAIIPKLTPCRIREYLPTDLDACVEIYHSNEPDLVSPEAFQGFLNFLEIGTSYFLVIEHDGDVIACGGLELVGDTDTATLVQGMVHRDYHRQGFGTTLLAARMALLEPEERPLELWLEMTRSSAPFYGHFGFELHSLTQNPTGPEQERARAWLSLDDQDVLDLRTALADREIHIYLNQDEIEDDTEETTDP